MKVKIYAPSYKRPEKSITQKLYPSIKLVVKESEAKEYLENGNDIEVCPDSAQGNVSKIRNWILDNLMEDADCLILMDDDCKGVGRWEKQEWSLFKEDELYEFAEIHTQLCKDFGFMFWGVNCVTDKGAYREYSPFGTLQYIGSPFSAHLKESDIRYDLNLPLKEDYDLTLQHIQKYGGCLRVNYASYNVKQAEQEGGCATMRNTEVEKKQFFDLQKKWGRDIIKRDNSSKRSFDFNPIIKVPIKGM
ncbi:MAG: hypothetical protein Unbinned176contig1000_39 [Prokaryotic dsDNA virus sp.]|nr:MAG: hypothetical protein Unbinned176contig1000_39 [Prokaryotic dsDNA virus sp.]|tara:strand:+ start:21786 stop:22526 length:741 start_codon:yes stop_codon:yes gene_type:complete